MAGIRLHHWQPNRTELADAKPSIRSIAHLLWESYTSRKAIGFRSAASRLLAIIFQYIYYFITVYCVCFMGQK